LALIPTNMAEAFEFAKIMSSGRTSVPAFLINNAGDCLRIVAIACRCGLDPFAIADGAYVVKDGGRMAFEAKTVYGIVLASGILDGDLQTTVVGAGEDMIAVVIGKRRNGQPHKETYTLRTITTRNSPLWKQQPRQQLIYYAQRGWCRLHAPDALMGMIARDDAPIDVTPEPVAPRTAMDLVTATLETPHDPDTGEIDAAATEHMAAIKSETPVVKESLNTAPGTNPVNTGRTLSFAVPIGIEPAPRGWADHRDEILRRLAAAPEHAGAIEAANRAAIAASPHRADIAAAINAASQAATLAGG
jgi:hypothetical protein